MPSKVSVSKGIKTITSKIEWPNTSVFLSGDGESTTIIRSAASSAITMVDMSALVSYHSGGVSNLTIDGVSAAKSGVGILHASGFLVFEKLKIINCGSHAIHNYGTGINSYYISIMAQGNGGDGLRLERTSAGILGNHIWGYRSYLNTGYGLYLDIDIGLEGIGLLLEGNTAGELYIKRGLDININYLDIESSAAKIIYIPSTADALTGNISIKTCYLSAGAGSVPVDLRSNAGGQVKLENFRITGDDTPCNFAATMGHLVLDDFQSVTTPTFAVTSYDIKRSNRFVPIGSIRSDLANLLTILGSNTKLLLPCNEISGTTLTDYSGNGHDFTVSADISTLTNPTATGGRTPLLKLSKAASEYFYIADHADFSAVSGGADIAFSLGLLVNMTTLGIYSIVFAKGNFLGAETTREYWLSLDTDNEPTFRCFDESTNGYIGRRCSPNVLGVDTYRIIVTYDGSGLASGIKIFSNKVQIDTGDASGGSYVAMEDLGGRLSFGASDDVLNHAPDGISMIAFLKGEDISATPWKLQAFDQYLQGMVEQG